MRIFKAVICCLLIAFGAMFCGCNNDAVVGTWEIFGYSYTFDNQEKYYTITDANALQYDSTVEDNNQVEQYYVNCVVYINANREETNFEFKNNNICVFLNEENKWTRENEKILLEKGEDTTIECAIVDNNLIMQYPVNGIVINLHLRKK